MTSSCARALLADKAKRANIAINRSLCIASVELYQISAVVYTVLMVFSILLPLLS